MTSEQNKIPIKNWLKKGHIEMKLTYSKKEVILSLPKKLKNITLKKSKKGQGTNITKI